MVDPSDGHKGIYFSDSNTAEQVRLYFTQNYPRPRDITAMMGRLARGYALDNMEAFRSKLVGRQKMISKSMRFSRKVVGDSSAEAPHNNTSLFFNEVLNISGHDVRGSYRPPQNSLAPGPQLSSSQVRSISRATQLATTMQRHYASRFAEEWTQRARAGASPHKQPL